MMNGMKKYIFAGLLAASIFFIAAAQEQKRPAPVTITGTVTVSDSVAVIVTSDGKEYTIVTMDGERKRPPEFAEGDGKRPPEPPKNAGKGKNKENPPQPPRPVTKDEVMMLEGQLVSITGMIPSDTDEKRKDAPKPHTDDWPTPAKDGYIIIHSYEVEQH